MKYNIRLNGIVITGTSWRTSKLSRSISVNLIAASLDKQKIVSSLIETYRNIMGKWRLHNGVHVLYHTENRRGHGFFSFLSRIRELANFNHTESLFFFSHGWSRTVTDFSCHETCLGPTDRREVICELANFCLPWPSAILRVIKRNSKIRKFENSG